jgi:hypothetical protein
MGPRLSLAARLLAWLQSHGLFRRDDDWKGERWTGGDSRRVRFQNPQEDVECAPIAWLRKLDPLAQPATTETQEPTKEAV